MTLVFDYIAERFEREIVLHLVKVLYSDIEKTPLILGIAGEPGEGKTYQCKEILKRLNVKIFEFASGEFEDRLAGKPKEKLKRIYIEACNCISKGEDAAIVIDDIDVAIGNWGSMYQYTVNTQNVIGLLMSLADDHAGALLLDEEDYDENLELTDFIRVPIFITGNDFSKLYGPLKRTGRMSVFTWKPTVQEKVISVLYLFDWLTLEESTLFVESINKLCFRYGYSEAPISFYTALKSRLYDNEIWDKYLIQKKNIVSTFKLQKFICNDMTKQIDLELLLNLGKNMLEEMFNSDTSYLNLNKKPHLRRRGNYGRNNYKNRNYHI